MEVDAAPQPANDPLIFATDHARYVVVGTRFRLYRETAASRLELDEGKVRVEREIDGETVEVSAGHVAVARADRAPLDVQPIAAGRADLTSTLVKGGDDVAFSADGNRFATSHWERGLRMWTPGDPAPGHEHDAKVGRSDGLTLAGERVVHVNDGKRGVVTLWRSGGGDARRVSLPGKSVRSRALSPNGTFVAESGEDGTFVYSIDLAKVKRSRIAELPSKGKAWCLSLSNSAQFVAAGYWDGTVRVYDTSSDASSGPNATPSEIVFETRLTHTPTQIALSSDGGRLAVYTHKDGLLLINVGTDRQKSLWAGGAAGVACLKFTADGQQVVAGLNDRTARMWSVVDGRALLVIDVGHVPRGIAWASEPSLLATAGGRVKLWKCELP